MHAITYDPVQYDETTLQTMQLGDAAREEFAQELTHILSPYEHFTDFLLAVQPAFASLPAFLRKEILTFRDDPTAPGAMLLRNLPLDPQLPDTPCGQQSLSKTSFFSEACAVGFAQLLGSVFGYSAQNEGALIHNITPAQDQQFSMSSQGTAIELSFHVENAAVSPRPHFIVLVCLRADKYGHARTDIVAAKTIAAHLDHESVEALQAAEFKLQSPESFANGLGVWWSEPRPVLTGPPACPEIWLNLYGIQPLTVRAERALNALRRVLLTPGVVQGVFLKPGDVLVLNNRKVMHGRSTFSAVFDGQDRWLQRVYAHADLWPWRSQAGVSDRLF